MITDDQGTQILHKMDEKFEELTKKMDEGFKKVDKRFDHIDKKLEIIEMYVANHDNQLKKLPTRDEFEKHEKQNLEFQYAVAKKLEMKKFAKA